MVPNICAANILSPNTKCACNIVDTGPMLEIMAVLFEPIRLRPAEIKNEGMTVATMASNNPYGQFPANVWKGISKLFLKRKCTNTPTVALSIA